jgi:hypothetical protein
MEIYPGHGVTLIDCTAEPSERDAVGGLETHLQHNHYYPFAMRRKSKSMQCGIKKQGVKMYYDNMLKEKNAALQVRSFKMGDGVRNIMATVSADQAVGLWELHTLKDMGWTDNHQC